MVDTVAGVLEGVCRGALLTNANHYGAAVTQYITMMMHWSQVLRFDPPTSPQEAANRHVPFPWEAAGLQAIISLASLLNFVEILDERYLTNTLPPEVEDSCIRARVASKALIQHLAQWTLVGDDADVSIAGLPSIIEAWTLNLVRLTLSNLQAKWSWNKGLHSLHAQQLQAFIQDNPLAKEKDIFASKLTFYFDASLWLDPTSNSSVQPPTEACNLSGFASYSNGVIDMMSYTTLDEGFHRFIENNPKPSKRRKLLSS
jgi:hypothetical protein